MAAPAPDVFAALGNPVRRRILELLRTRPRTSGEIATAFVGRHREMVRRRR
jgi:predicted transcriptional regulator